MDENISTQSILKVKIDGEWIEIPALRGSSVYVLSIDPRTDSIEEDGVIKIRQGFDIKIYDERKAQTTPGYQYDLITLWNGVDGTGTVSTVDMQPVTFGTTNVNLQAISYGRDQSSLTVAQKAQARSNIDAQIAGNYITSPNDKIVNQYLQYLGNDNWTTSTVQTLPISTATGVLVKTSSDMNSLSWMAALTQSEIDTILEA